MSPFGYTVLGFGGGKNQVPIAEDLTDFYHEIDATGTSNVPMGHIAIDPFDSTRILMVFRDDGTYGSDLQAVCGTIDYAGSDITWGTVVDVTTEYADGGFVEFDPSTQHSFMVYGGFRSSNTPYHGAVAGTLSGTTITLGSIVNISTVGTNDTVYYTNGKFNPNTAGQFVCIGLNYNNFTTYRNADIKVLSVSGTTITEEFEDNAVINQNCSQPIISWDITAQTGYIWLNGDSTYPRVFPFSMSGHTPTIGSEHIISSSSSGEYCWGASDGALAGRIVSTYKKSDGHMYCRVGNNSSGTITWGTEVKAADFDDLGSHLMLYNQVQCDKNTPGKFLFSWNVNTASPRRAKVGTITDADTITYGSDVNGIGGTEGTDIIWNDVRPDPNNPGRFWMGGKHTGDGSKGKITASQIASFEL
jgi:hypothetical protein